MSALPLSRKPTIGAHSERQTSSSIVGALSVNPSALPLSPLPPRRTLCRRATPRLPLSLSSSCNPSSSVSLLPSRVLISKCCQKKVINPVKESAIS
ncbi:hypothetical protein PIB30_065170 [Stylosanthes scabra]|uniref:Uncharacterized protein n=1 Tax=Stylosanthes scabra TaxID=79078 RepID=A0ABU6TPB1_9FABA|nr:hypothetical protein [Stylosanthes scabra]